MAAKTPKSKKPASPKMQRGESASTGEPTMAELLANAPQKIRGFSFGDKVVGRVVAKTPKSLILDIGAKSDGVVTEKAFVEARNFIRGLKEGEEVSAIVLVGETKEGEVLLSLRQASRDALWKRLEKAKKEGTSLSALGKLANPSGVTVEMEGLVGFVPTSQLGADAAKNPQALVGKIFQVKVIELERSQNKIVFSEKEVSEAETIKAAKEALLTIKEGEVYDGEVTTVSGFGCFVRILIKDKKGSEIGVDGLVHISEISWQKVSKPSDVCKEGDKVKVKVIGKRNGKLALSIKQAQEDPWETIEEKYKPDTRVKGEVSRTTDFGVFVTLEPGVEGLIHITKLPPGKKLKVGEKVDVYVEEVSQKERRISLGLVLTEKPVGYK